MGYDYPKYARHWLADEGRLRELIGPDEKLLWCGRPVQGIVFRKADALIIPISLIWLGIAVKVTYNIFTRSEDVVSMVMASLFVLAGLFIAVGRFYADSRARAKAVYALTDKSIIYVSGPEIKIQRRFPLSSQPEPILVRETYGRGSIWFGKPVGTLQSAGFGYRAPHTAPVAHFDLIENPQAVYELIIDARKSLNARSNIRS